MNAPLLTGANLKVSRAKKHLEELYVALEAFNATEPYTFIEEIDSKTGEEVIRVRVNRCPPADLSIIIGDLVHNLRAALDQTACDLIRANRRQVKRRNGFPIGSDEKGLDEALVGKLDGASTEAKRFVRRLKPYKGGNYALWLLHELDAMDKHVEIVPVGASRVQIHNAFPFPIAFVPSGEPGMAHPVIGNFLHVGEPIGDKGILLLEDEVEVYRQPADPNYKKLVAIHVTLGNTRIIQGGEPITHLLESILKLVERIVSIAARRLIS